MFHIIKKIMQFLFGRSVDVNPVVLLLVLVVPTALGLALGPNIGQSYAERQFAGVSRHKEAVVIQKARTMKWTCAACGFGIGVILLLLLVLVGV